MSSFHLLDLPLELRDSIYEYIVRSGSLTKLPTLSHQVRREAIKLLHRKATYSGLSTTTAPERRCTGLRIFLHNNFSAPMTRSAQDLDSFLPQNEGCPMQDHLTVIVEYGRIMRWRRMFVNLDKIRGFECWWSLVLSVVWNGQW